MFLFFALNVDKWMSGEKGEGIRYAGMEGWLVGGWVSCIPFYANIP